MINRYNFHKYSIIMIIITTLFQVDNIFSVSKFSLSLVGEKLERQVLIERNSKLKEENSDLNKMAERLSRRMEVLFHSQQIYILSVGPR